MNITDGAILVFWLVCLIRGIVRGPVNELFSIAGVLICLFAAAFYFSTIVTFLPEWIGTVQLRYLICFLILFGFMYFLMNLFVTIAAYLLHLRRSGRINRIFGAGFGAFKGVLVVAVLLLPLVAFLPKNSKWISDSAILPYAEFFSEKMVPVIPAALNGPFTSHMDGYKQSWHRNGELSNVR